VRGGVHELCAITGSGDTANETAPLEGQNCPCEGKGGTLFNPYNVKND